MNHGTTPAQAAGMPLMDDQAIPGGGVCGLFGSHQTEMYDVRMAEIAAGLTRAAAPRRAALETPFGVPVEIDEDDDDQSIIQELQFAGLLQPGANDVEIIRSADGIDILDPEDLMGEPLIRLVQAGRPRRTGIRGDVVEDEEKDAFEDDVQAVASRRTAGKFNVGDVVMVKGPYAGDAHFFVKEVVERQSIDGVHPATTVYNLVNEMGEWLNHSFGESDLVLASGQNAPPPNNSALASRTPRTAGRERAAVLCDEALDNIYRAIEKLRDAILSGTFYEPDNENRATHLMSSSLSEAAAQLEDITMTESMAQESR